MRNYILSSFEPSNEEELIKYYQEAKLVSKDIRDYLGEYEIANGIIWGFESTITTIKREQLQGANVNDVINFLCREILKDE